jgi:hypothetical protein
MRSLLGWFLVFHGAVVFSVGIVSLGLAMIAAASLQAGALEVFDQIGLLLIVLSPVAALFVLAFGHLMILFGQSMTSTVWQPLPEHRPALWFLLQTLRQAARCALVGACLALIGGLVLPELREARLPAFTAIALLFAAHRALTLAIRRLHH